MIVDDDPVVLEVTREVLDEAGYEVTVRASSLGTSAAVLQERPDVVLIDVQMPGLSGDTLARLVRAQLPDTPMAIILHSSTDEAELQQLARGCGATGVIQKGSSPARFLAQLERCLRSAGRC
jgi:CheY-like chemotaxis protein